jgi:hypothetical protein
MQRFFHGTKTKKIQIRQILKETQVDSNQPNNTGTGTGTKTKT